MNIFHQKAISDNAIVKIVAMNKDAVKEDVAPLFEENA